MCLQKNSVKIKTDKCTDVLTALETEALPFLATSAMMLATLGVQEDWGFSRVGSRGRTPISWIFILASVSAGEGEDGNE